MKIPKYIDEALRKRTKLANKLDLVCSIVDKWLDENDIDCESYDTHTGVEIYCNPQESEKRVREAILNKEQYKMTDRIFIKGFDKNLRCRGYQFEIGKEYKIDLPAEYKLSDKDLCSDKVFHFCDGLSKVHNYYSCSDENNRFCIIEVLGQFCENGDKCGSNHIKIIREIVGEELRIAKGLTNGNTGLFNSGDCNSGDYNSGYRNSGYRNSGDCNSGYHNSGDYNSGHYNSGSDNSGDYNSGYRNSGCRNAGVFNKTNDSNGVFCNKEPKICIFNIQTDWTLEEFYASKYWDAIVSSDFPLTELEENSLKKNTYEEACRRWWSGMSEANKAIIKDIPNFDIDIFCDITGIDKKDV